MARIPALKKLIVEDFPKQYQDIISKIAYPFNTAIEQIVTAVNGQLTFDNFTWQFKTISFTVAPDGSLPSSASFVLTTTGKPLGLSIIQVINNTKSNQLLTTAPFATFTIGSNGLVTVNQITGLTASNNYTINLIVYS